MKKFREKLEQLNEQLKEDVRDLEETAFRISDMIDLQVDQEKLEDNLK